MKDAEKSREQLISELGELRQRNAELERSETEHGRVEEKLRESEETLRAIINASPLAIMAIDVNSKVTIWNPAAESIFGWTELEVLGQYNPLVPPEKTMEHQDLRERSFLGETFTGLEVIRQRKDCTLVDVRLSTAPVYDAKGDIKSIMAVIEDITERKLAEKALWESEQRYSSLFKNNHSVMLLIDPESADIVDANPAACSFYGWSREEITSMKITDINMLLREQVLQEMDHAKSEERKHFFFSHRLATKEIRDVEVYSGPIRLHGKELLYSIIHDITERKRAEEAQQKSEQRYRHLVETMNEGLAMADQDYTFTFVNETFCEMLGYSRDELVGHNLIEFVHDDSKEFMKDQMARRRRGEAKRFDLVWRTKDGHKIYTIISPRGFFDTEGCFTGSLGVLTNITDRKQVEEALQKAHDRLEHRTTELVKLNKKLKQEIEERKLAEQGLREREALLEIQTNELEEVNTALRVLLKRRDEDKTEVEEKILSNVKELVLPYLERIKKSGLDAKQSAYANILESNLNDIVSPFIHRLSSKYTDFTPTEIQIANLVKEGKTTKEIAEMLNSSSRTVEFHRKNIRKKIGIVNRKANLRSHLLSM